MAIVTRSHDFDSLCTPGAKVTDLLLPAADAKHAYRFQDTLAVMALWIAALRSSGRTGWEGYEMLQSLMGAHSPCLEHEVIAAKAVADASDAPAWASFGEFNENPAAGKLAQEFRRALDQFAGHSVSTASEPAQLDADYHAPDWLVPGIIARARTHQLSGSWESGKSLFREALTAASLLERPFLGRHIPRLRFQILDGEQAKEDVEVRMKALGVTDALFNRYVHFSGKDRLRSVKLATPAGDRWIQAVAEDFAPDVIWIDSLMRCCATGITNPDAVRLYDEVLSPLADRYNAGVIASHHHTKSSGNRVASSDASLGGAQFSGQADLTMTLARTRPITETALPDGTTRTESRLAFKPSKGARGNYITFEDREHIVVTGIRRADGATLSLSLDHLEAEPNLEERVLALLEDGPLGSTALAERLGVSRTGTALRTALERLAERSLVLKDKDTKSYALKHAQA